MRIYTAHTRLDRPPVLVREGWSLWATVFGPLWLLARGAWLPGLWALLAYGLVLAFAPAPTRPVLLLGLAVLMGLTGRDMQRWWLRRRGYRFEHVVSARSEDGAWSRLLSARPDLLADAAARLK